MVHVTKPDFLITWGFRMAAKDGTHGFSSHSCQGCSGWKFLGETWYSCWWTFFFFRKNGGGKKKSPNKKRGNTQGEKGSLRLGTLRKSHMRPTPPSRPQPRHPTDKPVRAIGKVAEKSHAAALLECCFRSQTVILGCGIFAQKTFWWEEIQGVGVTYICTFKIEIPTWASW